MVILSMHGLERLFLPESFKIVLAVVAAAAAAAVAEAGFLFLIIRWTIIHFILILDQCHEQEK